MSSLSEFLHDDHDVDDKDSRANVPSQQCHVQPGGGGEEEQDCSSSIRSSLLNKSLADIYSIVRRASTESATQSAAAAANGNPQEDDIQVIDNSANANNNSSSWYCNFEPNHEIFTEEENAILSQLAKELNMLHENDIISIWEESTIATLETLERRVSQSIQQLEQQREDSTASISIAEAAASAVNAAAASDPDFAASLNASSTLLHLNNNRTNNSNQKIPPKQQHLKQLQLESLSPPTAAANRSYLPGMYQQSQQERYLKDDSGSSTASSRPSLDMSSIVERASFLLDRRRPSDTSSVNNESDPSFVLRTSAFTKDQNAILARLSQELKMLEQETNSRGSGTTSGGSNPSERDGAAQAALEESSSVFTVMTEDRAADQQQHQYPRISSSQSTMTTNYLHRQNNMSLFSLEQELQQADAYGAYATRHSLSIVEVAAAAAAADPDFAASLNARLSLSSQGIMRNLIRSTSQRLSSSTARVEEQDSMGNSSKKEEAEEIELVEGREQKHSNEVQQELEETTKNTNNNSIGRRGCGVKRYVDEHIPCLSNHVSRFSSWVDSLQDRIQFICWKIGKIITLSP